MAEQAEGPIQPVYYPQSTRETDNKTALCALKRRGGVQQLPSLSPAHPTLEPPANTAATPSLSSSLLGVALARSCVLTTPVPALILPAWRVSER